MEVGLYGEVTSFLCHLYPTGLYDGKELPKFWPPFLILCLVPADSCSVLLCGFKAFRPQGSLRISGYLGSLGNRKNLTAAGNPHIIHHLDGLSLELGLRHGRALQYPSLFSLSPKCVRGLPINFT